jgi:hypothetical protein
MEGRRRKGYIEGVNARRKDSRELQDRQLLACNGNEEKGIAGREREGGYSSKVVAVELALSKARLPRTSCRERSGGWMSTKPRNSSRVVAVELALSKARLPRTSCRE